MNMRKVTSLTALITFMLLMLTSIILYIVPAGRVAYWANWKLWGLTKEEWGAVHINLGVLLLLSVFLHIYFNWNPMMGYLKNKARQFRLFTVDFNISLVVTLVVVFGTLAGIPPMSAVINLGARISEDANLYYGEPPYGHAEMSSLADFSYRVRVDLDQAVTRLSEAGIGVVDSNQSIGQLAEANGVSPQKIYLIMKPEAASATLSMPPEPPGGTGQRKLSVLCKMYGLDVDKVISRLAEQGVAATSEQTFKEIAAAGGKDPHAIYALVFELSRQ